MNRRNNIIGQLNPTRRTPRFYNVNIAAPSSEARCVLGVYVAPDGGCALQE